MFQFLENNKKGFTLIELLVVIAIIGLLSTLSILALNSARARARDAKRVADVKQIQTALEMCYNDTGNYPADAAHLAASTTAYLRLIPTPPTPVDGSSCPAVQPLYTYTKTGGTGSSGTSSYTINYCLGAAVNVITAGMQTATPAGIF